MTHHVGFLYLGDAHGNPVEVINEQRTAANLEGVGAHLYNVDPDGGCEGLAFAPCAMATDGTVTEWTALPAANPWDGSSAASGEALGFTIEEWTGIDGTHHTRSVAALANRPGGSMFGRQSHSHRVMALNLLVHGTTERGLMYLFRWLETLLLSACSPCSTTQMWLREHCPAGTADEELEEGLLRAENVVLLSGPEWVDPPVVELGCYVRRLTLTLAVGNPCLYRVPPAAVESDHSFVAASMPEGGFLETAPLQQWGGSGVQATATVLASDIGLTSPIVTISSPMMYDGLVRMVLPTLRIYGLRDVDNGGLPPEARRIGLITIHNLTSGYEVVVDCATGAVDARDATADREWSNGGQFVVPNYEFDAGFSGVKTITFDQCSGGEVIVEPALLETDWSNFANAWSVTIQAMTRSGCS